MLLVNSPIKESRNGDKTFKEEREVEREREREREREKERERQEIENFEERDH